MTETIDILMAKVANAIRRKALYQHDLDAIAMLTNAAKNKLPSRFVEIVSDMDKNFLHHSGDSRLNCLYRLNEIYEVSKLLPATSIDGLDSEELTPLFSLEEEETNEILDLCSKMRKIILSTNEFDQAHKVRLLNRISAIESEVHKEKGRFDVILAGVSEVGETLGKFGTSIKPLTDRMAEVAKITRSKTKAYDQIPAPEDVKQIEDKSGDD